MIRFKRKDKKVICEVNFGEGLTSCFLFEWNCEDEHFAYLLANHFKEQLGDNLEIIRADAYEQGWKDAKAKRRKQTWFSRWLS